MSAPAWARAARADRAVNEDTLVLSALGIAAVVSQQQPPVPGFLLVRWSWYWWW